MKESIRKKLMDFGAVAVGFAEAGNISEEADRQFQKWIDDGCHGEMGYLHRHISLRRHPDHVLEGSNTVISMAFSFQKPQKLSDGRPVVAAYAYGKDYHKVLRKTLKPLLYEFRELYGGKWRICIDSAPMAERYWALRSGIGRKGKNGAVIIDGIGSFCFLAEIVTTVEIDPDTPSAEKCMDCGKCIVSCPGNALHGDGTIDARKCVNYLTIEKTSEFTIEDSRILNSGPGFLFGCDICQRVCPHNYGPADAFAGKTLQDFRVNENIRNLTPSHILEMTEEEFKEAFRDSPLLYAGYSRLCRNARAILTPLKNSDGLMVNDK